jgi:hypothetical protein
MKRKPFSKFQKGDVVGKVESVEPMSNVNIDEVIPVEPQDPIAATSPWGNPPFDENQFACFFMEVIGSSGTPINSNDWVGAFDESKKLIGAKRWNTSACGGGVCEIMIYGGGISKTENINFKIYEGSGNVESKATASENVVFDTNNIKIVDSLTSVSSIGGNQPSPNQIRR